MAPCGGGKRSLAKSGCAGCTGPSLLLTPSARPANLGCFGQWRLMCPARLQGIIGILCTAILLLAGLAWRGVVVAAAGGVDGVFNVEDYGALGDGTTDGTKAFVDAWAAACGATGSSMTLLVPTAKSFLVDLTRFTGPCTSTRITVQARTARSSVYPDLGCGLASSDDQENLLWLSQVMGTITAPPASAWSENKNHWLMFYLVDGLTVTGNNTGLLDGRGQTWWVDKCKADNDDCVIKAPTALVVMNCTDVELSQFSSKDSPQIHIGLSMSGKVNPQHRRREDVHITGLTIGTGDDCISIGPGSLFVTVDGIVCGPGHGVSPNEDPASHLNTFVELCDIQNKNDMDNSVNMATPSNPKFLKWSQTAITFDQSDHPAHVPTPGRQALVVDPV
ncbi:hypothetical protein ZWY2020_020955, partial [Hordeum vulgare]